MRLPSARAAVGALLVLAAGAQAQTEGVLQIESDLERFVYRQYVLGRLPDFETGARPLNARRALALLDSAAAGGRGLELSATDRRLLDGYRGEAVAGVLGRAVADATPLYPTGQSFVRLEGDGYAVEGQPLVELAGGPATINRPITGAAPTEEVVPSFVFARGARAALQVNRFFFEGRVTENQRVTPLGPADRRRTGPRLGYVVVDRDDEGDPTYDFLASTAVVGYRDRFVEVRAGRDRNRMGVARGSTLFSNYAADYDHVRVQLDVGPVSGEAVYARFLDVPESFAPGLVTEQRYGVYHRASGRLGGGVEASVFEAVIFGDRDDDNRNGFEPAYLVPFGLYRVVERELGSPDNVMIGGDLAWRFADGYRVYGQGVLDELVAETFSEDAWTNKWAFVLGLELADPGIPGLGRLRDTDLRVEYARVRPYLYSHRDSLTGAVHYGDVLGHPAGPNASDLNVEARHRPFRDLELWADVSYTVRGRNTPDLNYGADAERPYDDRVPEPNPTLQGVRQRVLVGGAGASLRVLPDASLGATVRFLRVEDEEEGGSGVVVPELSLRWGLTPLGPRY